MEASYVHLERMLLDRTGLKRVSSFWTSSPDHEAEAEAPGTRRRHVHPRCKEVLIEKDYWAARAQHGRCLMLVRFTCRGTCVFFSGTVCMQAQKFHDDSE